MGKVTGFLELDRQDRKYRPDELVGVVKRIKEWGNLNN